MLPRSQKLSTKQLNLVMEKGKVVHSPFFWSRFIKQDGELKIAVICPQKIAKTAVKKNLIRRKVYSAIDLFINNLELGYHVIVCVKEPILKASPIEICNQAKAIFVKSGIMK